MEVKSSEVECTCRNTNFPSNNNFVNNNMGYDIPENLISLSSPIIISSIKSQWPNLIKSGASNVEQISPPKINVLNNCWKFIYTITVYDCSLQQTHNFVNFHECFKKVYIRSNNDQKCPTKKSSYYQSVQFS